MRDGHEGTDSRGEGYLNDGYLPDEEGVRQDGGSYERGGKDFGEGLNLVGGKDVRGGRQYNISPFPEHNHSAE